MKRRNICTPRGTSIHEYAFLKDNISASLNNINSQSDNIPDDQNTRYKFN